MPLSVSLPWPPSSSSLRLPPLIVPLLSYLLIFSLPSIFGQPSWLVLAATGPAHRAQVNAAISSVGRTAGRMRGSVLGRRRERNPQKWGIAGLQALASSRRAAAPPPTTPPPPRRH